MKRAKAEKAWESQNNQGGEAKEEPTLQPEEDWIERLGMTSFSTQFKLLNN